MPIPIAFWLLGGLGLGAGVYRLSSDASKVVQIVIIGGAAYFIYKKVKK